MQNIKDTEREHHEFVHGLGSSPPASNDASDRKTPDAEKVVQLEVDHSDPHLHDDDKVTLKTWAVVVVKSCSQEALKPIADHLCRCSQRPLASRSGLSHFLPLFSLNWQSNWALGRLRGPGSHRSTPWAAQLRS